jgi:hypothetical protein
MMINIHQNFDYDPLAYNYISIYNIRELCLLIAPNRGRPPSCSCSPGPVEGSKPEENLELAWCLGTPGKLPSSVSGSGRTLKGSSLGRLSRAVAVLCPKPNDTISLFIELDMGHDARELQQPVELIQGKQPTYVEDPRMVMYSRGQNPLFPESLRHMCIYL